ncbi:MAG: hypothetical protein ACK5V3_03860, partial [Bdellovibrionales bacterium]
MASQDILLKSVTRIISETNGIGLIDTLDLLLASNLENESPEAYHQVLDFRQKLDLFRLNKLGIQHLLSHPFSEALFQFLKRFPLKYREEHTHLTGAVTAEFVYPHLMKMLSGPQREIYEKKIKDVYGEEALPIKTVEDVEKLMT